MASSAKQNTDGSMGFEIGNENAFANLTIDFVLKVGDKVGLTSCDYKNAISQNSEKLEIEALPVDSNQNQ